MACNYTASPPKSGTIKNGISAERLRSLSTPFNCNINMTRTYPATEIRFHASIAEIGASAWNDLLALAPEPSPAASYTYLHALETSGSVGGASGWQVRHAGLWRDGILHAAMPLYLKSHSWGEYVFDWAWARAYQQHGLAYYPRLVAAIPFTPVGGSRLLARQDADARELLAAILVHAEQQELSSVHILFPSIAEKEHYLAAGLSLRQGLQFHWHNRDQEGNKYEDFNHFLSSMQARKRKNIRQERRRAASYGLQLRWLDGHNAKEEDWRFFHDCYAGTCQRHGGSAYLGIDFFLRLASAQPDQILLLIAAKDGQPLACAFFLRDEQNLYGRYWGSTRDLPCLHFELCYYQAIEYCIRHGLTRFEGGAQGEHKLARGLTATPTYSAHWIAQPQFRAAIARFVEQESGLMQHYLDELDERRPFRQQ